MSAESSEVSRPDRLPRKLAKAVALGAVLCASAGWATTAAADPRVRGGFSIDGGYMGAFSSEDHASGGAISVAGRIGVQIGDVFGLYYENTPMGWILFEHGGPKVGGSDFNSLLADFTISDIFGVGIGPSLDLVDTKQLPGSGSLVEPGAQLRLALLLGSSSGSSRQAFAIGVDPHVTYWNGGVIFSLLGGIGAEWY